MLLSRPLANSPHARDIASVLHPQTNLRKHLEVGPSIITGGDGVWVTDINGKRYMEATAALWCASLGFKSERLAKVAYDAMRTLGYYQIFRHASNEPAIDLCERLLQIAPVPMSKVLLQCSGSEANDTAIKLVWYHWNAQDQPKKRKIISRLSSYHGSTCAAVSLTGKPEFHKGFGLPFDGFLYANCPHYYRDRLDGESEDAFSTRMADDLERLILAEGPDTVAAFFADPVQGAAGALPPPAGYFEKIQAVLRRYDILLVADEVITGFGRTGHMWGCQTYGIVPDIITCAKALSAAMQPVSAVLMNERIFQSMLVQSDRLGSFVHGYTYAGHPVACAVALETLRIYDEMDLVGRMSTLEPAFLSAFEALTDHPMVGDFSGVGLIGGIELVIDKASRKPISASIAARVDHHAREHGLILRMVGNRIALSPPLIISAAEIAELAMRLRGALDATWAELSSSSAEMVLA
jgi:4-aminobutyrate--pyruvate transaminase